MQYIKIAAILFLLAGCRQDSKKEAKAFFDQIHILLDKAEPPIAVIGDSIVSIQHRIQDDAEYQADTAQLKKLLETAIRTNRLVLDSMAILEEYEPQLGLKRAAQTYAEDWQTVLEEVFTHWIQELPLSIGSKAQYLENIVSPALQHNSELSKVLTAKNRVYKETFGF